MNHSRLVHHRRCVVPVSGKSNKPCGLVALAENLDQDGMWRWLCWWHARVGVDGGIQRLKLLNEAETIVTTLNMADLTAFHDALEAQGQL